jgi:hypothetical protein
MSNLMCKTDFFELNECVNNHVYSINVHEITVAKEKLKWVNRFIQCYSGDKRPLNLEMFGNSCKYFLAVVDGKEAGYIRISNYTDIFKKYSDLEVWSASEAYVKIPYRKNGILRVLLEYVIKNCNVKCMRIETERFDKNYRYYQSLGFDFSWTIDDDQYLCMAVTDDLTLAAKSRISDVFNT